MPQTVPIAAYESLGFAGPFVAMPSQQATHYRTLLERFEDTLGHRLSTGERMFRYKTHLLLPWVADLIRRPSVLDVVESLIGPNILCWTCSWFIKEAQSDALTLWHQDATFFGLRPHQHVTAWIALTPSNEENGCMHFVAKSNQGGLLEHATKADANSINGGGQRTVREFTLEQTDSLHLEPGEFSLHHTLCVHTSGPNQSRDRRIGLGVSYIPAEVGHIGTERMPATLVRGEDPFGHFDLESDPRSMDPERLSLLHRTHYQRYRVGYDEQMTWHKAGRWNEPRRG